MSLLELVARMFDFIARAWNNLHQFHGFWIGKIVDTACKTTGRNNFAVAGWLGVIGTTCYEFGWIKDIFKALETGRSGATTILLIVIAVSLRLGYLEVKDCFEMEERLGESDAIPLPKLGFFVKNRCLWVTLPLIFLPTGMSMSSFGMLLAGICGYAQMHINHGGKKLSDRIKGWLNKLVPVPALAPRHI